MEACRLPNWKEGDASVACKVEMAARANKEVLQSMVCLSEKMKGFV
jgi:hypothetical protein